MKIVRLDRPWVLRLLGEPSEEVWVGMAHQLIRVPVSLRIAISMQGLPLQVHEARYYLLSAIISTRFCPNYVMHDPLRRYTIN